MWKLIQLLMFVAKNYRVDTPMVRNITILRICSLSILKEKLIFFFYFLDLTFFFLFFLGAEKLQKICLYFMRDLMNTEEGNKIIRKTIKNM